MENSEIKALIEKYNLVRINGKIGTYQTRGIDRAAFQREVGPHKAEIYAYFDAQEKAAAELKAKRKATFEAIPGVKEIREARLQYGEARRKFNQVVESGSSIFPRWNAPTGEEMSEMERRWPMAVFALGIEERACNTSNYELLAIYENLYEALCDGQDPDAVKAEHDKQMHDFAARHIGD